MVSFRKDNVQDYVFSIIKSFNASKRYDLLTDLLNDSIFDDLVVKGAKTYNSLSASFEIYNELYFQLSKGITRYSSYNSWATIRAKRRQNKKLTCNSKK